MEICSKECHPVVDADSTASIGSIFTLMSQHEISSVPIKDGKKPGYIGTIDIKDLVRFLSYGSNANKPTHSSTNDVGTKLQPTEPITSLFGLVDRIQHRLGDEAVNVLKVSCSRPLKTVSNKASSAEVLQLLQEGYSRVYILGKDGNCECVQSQSDVCRELAALCLSSPAAVAVASAELDSLASKYSVSKIHSVVSKTLLELGLVKLNPSDSALGNIVHAHTDTEVIAALKMMADANLSAIPIVNSEHELVEVLSDDDIRMIMAPYCLDTTGTGTHPKTNLDLFGALSGGVMKFIQKIYSMYHNRRDPIACVVYPSTPLLKVIRQIAVTRAHRIYVVESSSNDTLVGVVSLVDILGCVFASETKGVSTSDHAADMAMEIGKAE